jgi:cell division protein FtsA
MNLKRFCAQFLKERYYCGLDIGSQKIKAALSRVQDADNLEILAVHESGIRGFEASAVNDISEFSSAISSTLDAVIKKAQVRFRDIYLGVGGDLVTTRKSRAIIPLVERGNKLITAHDVNDARHQARLLGTRIDEEVLHDFVQQFRVDDVNIALNPVGLYGRKLEVEVELVVANVTCLRNIGKAVKQAGFDVMNVYFNGQVLSDMVLDRRARQEGVVLVDMGARTTQVMVFKGGLLKHYTRVNFGGDSMTRRISQLLEVPLELAEDIKMSYARVPENRLVQNKEEILVKKDQSFIPVKRAMLNEAIEIEVETMVSLIREAVDASGYKDELKGGLVMVGGGALLAGLLERIEASLGGPVVLGRTIPGLNNASSFCASTCIAEQAYKGTVRYLFDSRRPKHWLEHFRQKAEEMCNEYF